MYVTIIDIVGEKRIDLSYLIKNFDSSKAVAVVSLFSDNNQYEFSKHWMIELKSGNKEVTEGTIHMREGNWPTS